MDAKILIRSLKSTDRFQLAVLANNKKVWDNLRDYIPFPYNEDDATVFINSVQQENPKQTFAIEYNGEFSGIISLVIQKDVYRKSAEIGFWLGEPYWGKGITSKAIALITEYGFNELQLNRIYAGVFDYNIASMKVLEKNGFKKEGIFKNAILKNDQVYDEHRYYKLKDS